MGEIHRIGGGSVGNLRLKLAEEKLDPPGISVLKAPAPVDVVAQVRSAFPGATRLLEAAKVIGTTSEEAIRQAGFELLPDPTRRFPNHHRIIHPAGAAGFTDENLARLSAAFSETTE